VRFSAPRLSVEYEGGRFDDEAMLVVCANCWRFGGGMRIAPEASIVDGLLDVVIVRRVSRLAAVPLLLRVYSGRHVDHPAVTVIKTAWARVSLDRELEMYGDGEPLLRVGREPLAVQAVPAALSIVDRPQAPVRPPAEPTSRRRTRRPAPAAVPRRS
jgi:diacylglycerol kinase (ATP)